MSFFPLPTVLRTDLARRPDARRVELGCGDGRFTRILREDGARIIAVDRLIPAGGDSIDAAADATRPPFRRLDGLITANLLRHLWGPGGALDLLGLWIACLAPGGSLWILEDEPTWTPGPADTYRRLQDWLAEIVPWRRGLLPRKRVEDALAGHPSPGRWTFGTASNRFRSPDPDDVISWLSDDAGVMCDDAASLADRIRRTGLSYGDYWWARYERMPR